MYKQQKQTENYFNRDATNWSKKSSLKNPGHSIQYISGTYM